jgi:pimeloyl-ACP methyl ester carboxylesterase
VPEAPRWFVSAVAAIPAPTLTKVDGTALETYVWGSRGARGILFLHGMRAHAGWWNFLAPLFADDYRVASFSLSGMGRSAWRAHYSIDLHAQEALAVADATGLFDNSKHGPILIAHSFGSRPAVRAAQRWGNRLSGCVIVDSALSEFRASVPLASERKVFLSQAEALRRFRFAPNQECRNTYIADFLARDALHRIRNPDGWVWRFDPDYGQRLASIPDQTIELGHLSCRHAFIYGHSSRLTPPLVQQAHRRSSPLGTTYISVPDAGHHVMVDQPLLLAAELRSILKQWQHAPID